MLVRIFGVCYVEFYILLMSLSANPIVVSVVFTSSGQGWKRSQTPPLNCSRSVPCLGLQENKLKAASCQSATLAMKDAVQIAAQNPIGISLSRN